MEEQNYLEQLREMLHWKKNTSFYASRLGISEEEVNSLRQQLKKENEPHTESPSATTASFSQDVKGGKAEATFTLPEEIRNLEDLIEKCNIDTETWEIISYRQNFWGNSSNPHWQVKANMELRKDKQEDILAETLQNYVSTYTPLSKKDILINDVYTRPTCVLISLADFHLDKKTVEGTTISEKVATYEDVLNKLLYKAYKSHYLEEIVFLIGNDYMHIDNYHSTTTNLTPQDTLGTWHGAYEIGFDLLVRSISKLKQFCNKLTVVHVPSNHSRTKEYYMAHALEVFFKADPNIVFNRTADNTKVHVFGECFIGMHHGDTVSDKLPLYFASKYYKEWGMCRHKEIALADKHHRKEWKLSLSAGEADGIRMFIAPSLSGADKWHKDKGYDLAVKAGLARVYDYETGYCGEFEERI